MKLIPGLGLVLLGLALGFIVTWAVGAGASVGLFVGVLLVMAGAIVGFVVEWWIDEAHRRNRDQIEINVQAHVPESIPQSEATILAGLLSQRETELRELRQKLSATEAELTECRLIREAQARELKPLPSLKEKLGTTEAELMQWKLKPGELQTKLEARQAELADYRTKYEVQLRELERLRAYKTKVETTPDDLTAIKGIGKVYQGKLANIGITTYKQLAEADPARIRRMLDIKAWQAVDITAWVTQAKDWVQRGS